MKGLSTQPAGADRARDETGAALILSLAFVFLLGVVFVALAGFATNAFRNTSNFKYQRTLATDAETMATGSIQYLRANYGPGSLYSVTAQPCPGTSGSIGSSDPSSGQNNAIVLECIGTWAPEKAVTRTIDVFACAPGTIASTCSSSQSLLLHAQAQYDDYAVTGAHNCDTSSSTTCGTAMTISQWDVLFADS